MYRGDGPGQFVALIQYARQRQVHSQACSLTLVSVQQLHDAVARLTLKRPECLNAFSVSLDYDARL